MNTYVNIKSATYFVARIGEIWLPSYDYLGNMTMNKHPDWWGAIALRNISDAPQSTNLLFFEFDTGKFIKSLPIVLPAKSGKRIIWEKITGDEGINLQGLENKILSLELDWMSPGSKEIQMTPTMSRGKDALLPLNVDDMRTEITKKY